MGRIIARHLNIWKLMVSEGTVKPGGYNGKNRAILRVPSKNYVMTIQDAQQRVDDWIKNVGVRYFNELTNTAILAEEVGELASHMARIYGEQSYKKDDPRKPAPGKEKEVLADEMADVLWVLICLANQAGVDLEDALQKNFDKKQKRDSLRHQENQKLKDDLPR